MSRGTGASAAVGMAEDAESGVHDRLRSLPIPRLAIVAGRSLDSIAAYAAMVAFAACTILPMPPVKASNKAVTTISNTPPPANSAHSTLDWAPA